MLDRIKSNIESLPEEREGSNILRHMFENVQEPLLNALKRNFPAFNPFSYLSWNQTDGLFEDPLAPCSF